MLDGADKAVVDLDHVERVVAQTADRRIARTEVVHGQAHAEGLDLVEQREDVITVLQQGGFGDLQLQPLRRQTTVGQCAAEVVEKPIVQLLRRQVHRDHRIAGPLACIVASLAQHPAAQRDDLPTVLGQGNELLRQQQAAFGMLPADQRLGAGDPQVVTAKPWLVVNFELLLGNRVAQLLFAFEALLQALVQFMAVEAPGTAAVGLGLVQGYVGAAQQLAGAGRIVRRDGDTDAGADKDLVAVDLERAGNGLDNARAELVDGLAFDQSAKDHDELVATDPRDQVLLARAALETVCDAIEHFVSGSVAEHVVHWLETIQVDVEHRQLGLAALLCGQARLKVLAHARAVRQPGQRVMLGKVGNACLGAGLFGDVTGRAAVAGQLPAVPNRPCDQPANAFATVGRAVAAAQGMAGGGQPLLDGGVVGDQQVDQWATEPLSGRVPGDLLEAVGEVAELRLGIGLPDPVRRRFGNVAKARLACRQGATAVCQVRIAFVHQLDGAHGLA